MADLGGGSVEVSLVDGSGVLWSESHTIGSVRLLEELTQAGEEPGRFAELLAEYVAALRLPVARAQRERWPASSPPAATSRRSRVWPTPTPTATGPVRLPLAPLRGLVETLSRLSFRERVEHLGLREDRADVILPAALVYERLCHLSGCGEITVPFVGLREGVMLDLVEEALAHGARRARREQETLTAAVALGRHYVFDEAHAVHVARLAVSLFDQLESLHALGETERRILLSAGALHDIGPFVSFKRHHKHSFYLIANSELPGLTRARDAARRQHRALPPQGGTKRIARGLRRPGRARARACGQAGQHPAPRRCPRPRAPAACATRSRPGSMAASSCYACWAPVPCCSNTGR